MVKSGFHNCPFCNSERSVYISFDKKQGICSNCKKRVRPCQMDLDYGRTVDEI